MCGKPWRMAEQVMKSSPREGKKLSKKQNGAQNSIGCVECHSMLNIGLFTSLNFKYLNLWTTSITFLAAQKY